MSVSCVCLSVCVVSLDILHRIMRDVAGYSVLVCQNVTDIDDKIILRSSEVQMPFAEFAKKYELEFNQDIYGSLGCAVPDIVTRVSDYVQEIISFIEQLVANGVAYQANGSVYFSVADFVAKGHTYGKLMPEQVSEDGGRGGQGEEGDAAVLLHLLGMI